MVRYLKKILNFKKTDKKRYTKQVVYSSDKKKPIKNGRELQVDDLIAIKFHDGCIKAKVLGIKNNDGR